VLLLVTVLIQVAFRQIWVLRPWLFGRGAGAAIQCFAEGSGATIWVKGQGAGASDLGLKGRDPVTSRYALGRVRVASREALGGDRVLAGDGLGYEDRRSVFLSAQDRERFSASTSLAWHAQAFGKVVPCQRLVGGRSRLGLELRPKVVSAFAKRLARIFEYGALSSQIRRLRAPCFCKAYGIGLPLGRKVGLAHRIGKAGNSRLIRI
jgi:hypothetical protein